MSDSWMNNLYFNHVFPKKVLRKHLRILHKGVFCVTSWWFVCAPHPQSTVEDGENDAIQDENPIQDEAYVHVSSSVLHETHTHTHLSPTTVMLRQTGDLKVFFKGKLWWINRKKKDIKEHSYQVDCRGDGGSARRLTEKCL